MSLKSRILIFFIDGILKTIRTGKRNIRTKIVEKYAVGELNAYFQGGNKMETKSKWKSKTVWTAIVGVLLGAVQPISAAVGHPVVVPAWVYETLGAFGIYAIRDGIGKPLQ